MERKPSEEKEKMMERNTSERNPNERKRRKTIEINRKRKPDNNILFGWSLNLFSKLEN